MQPAVIQLPIRIPLTVRPIEAQGQHMLCICCPPPSAWALQALLDDVAMGAFNFTRANREVARQRVLVVELFASMAQYQGWLDTLTALQAAAITGRFAQSENAEQAGARRVALQRCREIDGIVARLRLAAAKEKQMARQVAINLSIKARLAGTTATY